MGTYFSEGEKPSPASRGLIAAEQSRAFGRSAEQRAFWENSKVSNHFTKGVADIYYIFGLVAGVLICGSVIPWGNTGFTPIRISPKSHLIAWYTSGFE